MVPRTAPARHWLPVAILAVLAGTGWIAFGDALTFDALVAQRDALVARVDQAPLLSVLVYGLAYGAVVVLALPVALLMTLVGGWLFGPVTGSIVTVLAATTGALALFILARGLLHDFFLARTGSAIATLRRGFQANAASYLLTVRLAPVFPFFIVNIAAALLGARFTTYAWTTLVGIIPGTVAYSIAGAGLGSVLDKEAARLALCRAQGGACSASLDVTTLVSGDVALALGALAAVTLLSTVARRWLGLTSAPAPLAMTTKDPHD